MQELSRTQRVARSCKSYNLNQKLGYSIDELFNTLNGNGFDVYCKLRTHCKDKLKPYIVNDSHFNSFWARMMQRILLVHGYVPPNSNNPVAKYAREHRKRQARVKAKAKLQS